MDLMAREAELTGISLRFHATTTSSTMSNGWSNTWYDEPPPPLPTSNDQALGLGFESVGSGSLSHRTVPVVEEKLRGTPYEQVAVAFVSGWVTGIGIGVDG
jgi:hypothetical protein